MQGRYVGDAGDFGKYGLLRSLCRGDERGAALRLGVLWYRFDGDDSATTNDGRHADYLFAPSRNERLLRRCDHELFKKMLHLVNNDRSIAAVCQGRRDLVPVGAEQLWTIWVRSSG